MTDSNQTLGENLKTSWESANSEERKQFREWAGLVSKAELVNELEILENLESLELFFAERLKDTQKRFQEEFEDNYQLAIKHMVDIKAKLHGLIHSEE